MFAVWGGGDPREAVLKTLLLHCGSQTDVDAIRPHLDGVRWKAPEGIEEEA